MNQYVVVDLEMCKVPYSNRKKEFHGANETIQIGAVLLNEKYEVVDEFNTYVRPEFGSLDWFITNLTGITSKDLKSARNNERSNEGIYSLDSGRCICCILE